MTEHLSRSRVTLLAVWTLIGLLLWWLLSANQGWYLGLPVVLGASALAVALDLPTPRPGTLIRLPRFVVFFVIALWRGGWDVARRAVSPSLPIAPAWTDYHMDEHYRHHPLYPRLRLLTSALIGLLPGTLASRYDGDILRIHVLDEHTDWQAATSRLEHELARLMEMPEQ